MAYGCRSFVSGGARNSLWNHQLVGYLHWWSTTLLLACCCLGLLLGGLWYRLTTFQAACRFLSGETFHVPLSLAESQPSSWPNHRIPCASFTLQSLSHEPIVLYGLQSRCDRKVVGEFPRSLSFGQTCELWISGTPVPDEEDQKARSVAILLTSIGAFTVEVIWSNGTSHVSVMRAVPRRIDDPSRLYRPVVGRR